MSIRNRLLDIVSPVWLDITQADIDAARANKDKTYNCPGQRAAARQWGQEKVFVGRHTVYGSYGSNVRFEGGEPLREFTTRWDSSTNEVGQDPWLDMSQGDATPIRIRLHREDF